MYYVTNLPNNIVNRGAKLFSHKNYFLATYQNFEANFGTFGQFQIQWHWAGDQLFGGSRGQVVIRGDSYSKGDEFKSLHHILDVQFFTLICFENWNVCEKKMEKMKKRSEKAVFKTDFGYLSKFWNNRLKMLG